MQSLPVKIGTWGGHGGQPRDVKRTPKRLTDITVRSDDEHINSVQFTYIDRDGVLQDEGPWGGDGGDLKPPVL
jgi:hypothetical protein